QRAMAVVARVSYGAALVGEVRALAEAGVDAIEIAVRDGEAGSKRSSAMREAIAAVTIPCGVFIAAAGTSTNDWSAVLDVAGLDWVHVPPEAPARLLAAKEITRLVSLTPAMPPGRLAGLPGLKADVFVVDNPTPGGPFTADTLLALCAAEAATQKPVLAGSGL